MPRNWFVSHPSGAIEHTPVFFNAMRDFAEEAAGNPNIILPHEKHEEVDMTKADIQNSVLVIAEVSIPSTGSGIEIGWAHSAGIPIVLFHQGGSTFSPSLKFVTQDHYTYVTEDSILKVLREKK